MVAREQVRVELRRLDNSTLSVRDPQSAGPFRRSPCFAPLPCADTPPAGGPGRAEARPGPLKRDVRRRAIGRPPRMLESAPRGNAVIAAPASPPRLRVGPPRDW